MRLYDDSMDSIESCRDTHGEQGWELDLMKWGDNYNLTSAVDANEHLYEPREA